MLLECYLLCLLTCDIAKDPDSLPTNVSMRRGDEADEDSASTTALVWSKVPKVMLVRAHAASN